MIYTRRSWTAACMIALACTTQVFAQEKYPTRTIRFISPAAPGALSDTLPRLLATDLAASMSTPVIVENRPGAGGVIGTTAVARAPADGYTLLLGTGGSMTLNPYLVPNISYDAKADFQGLALMAFTPLYLVVRADSPYRTLDELVVAAKANPGKLAYGTIGAGSTAGIASGLLARAKGLDLIDVPYAGYAPGLNELLAGRLAFFMVDGSSLARIEGGSLRALAVTTSHRARRLPNVPTLKELGVDVDLSVWFAVYARAGLPREAAQRLQQELRQAVERPAFRSQLTLFGLEPGNMFGEEFHKWHLAELKRWGETLPAMGLKVN